MGHVIENDATYVWGALLKGATPAQFIHGDIFKNKTEKRLSGKAMRDLTSPKVKTIEEFVIYNPIEVNFKKNETYFFFKMVDEKDGELVAQITAMTDPTRRGSLEDGDVVTTERIDPSQYYGDNKYQTQMARRQAEEEKQARLQVQGQYEKLSTEVVTNVLGKLDAMLARQDVLIDQVVEARVAAAQSTARLEGLQQAQTLADAAEERAYKAYEKESKNNSGLMGLPPEALTAAVPVMLTGLFALGEKLMNRFFPDENAAPAQPQQPTDGDGYTTVPSIGPAGNLNGILTKQ